MWRVWSLGIAAVALLAAGGASATDSAARKAEICKEAQARYEGIEVEGGKPSGDGHAVVLMYKYNFCPGHLTVKKGTTVHFVNVDKRTSHSAWFKEAGKEESPRLFPDEIWSLPMLSEGDFPYLCGPHWKQEGMIGKVTVTP